MRPREGITDGVKRKIAIYVSLNFINKTLKKNLYNILSVVATKL